MSENPVVSFRVSSRKLSANAEIISAKEAARRPKSSPGLYLIKTGSAYLFQMRMPKSIAGAVKRPIRIGLGNLPKPEARRIANHLAAIARCEFEKIESAMTQAEDGDTGSWSLLEDIFGGDFDQLDEEAKGERAFQSVVMSLKAAMYDVRDPNPKPTKQQAEQFAVLREVVKTSKEKAKKDAGEPYDIAIGDNAKLLTERLWQRETADPGSTLRQAKGGSHGDGKISLQAALRKSEGVAEVDKDRREVERAASDKLLFSEAANEYLAQRIEENGGIVSKDIKTALRRLNIFTDLIGDHPIDRYTPTDLQAFVNLMQFWPPKAAGRPAHLTVREILDSNRDFSKGVIKKATLQNGFMGSIKPVFSYAATQHSFDNPIKNVALKYSKATLAPISAEPLSSQKLAKLFRTSVQSPYIDDVMLPLLGLLTSRRLGLLTHMMGRDISNKFGGVWVATVTRNTEIDGKTIRRPIKNQESGRYFVLHNFLVEIGWVDWARSQGNNFLFPQLMGLADPAKQASTYMRRLFEKAGIKDNPGERYHSLRGVYISDARQETETSARSRRLQAGHAIGGDDHEGYGWKVLTEHEARVFARMPLNPEIDFSIFRGLDFEKLAAARRRKGR